MLGRFMSHFVRTANVRSRRHRRTISCLTRALTDRGHYTEALEARHMLAGDPIVTVDTNFGNFQIQLFPSAAPQTVANFLTYVDDGVYSDAIFHRSVPGFVEQTGGFLSASQTFSGSTSQFTPITTNAPIPLEYNLPNTFGTVAMARGSAANSATSQWFVNLADNSKTLGPGGSDANGYAVFGQVIGNGMVVLANIAKLPIDNVDNGTFAQLPLGANNLLVQISSVHVDSIDGTVFSDANANGQLDTGEPGVAGRTVFLDNDGSGVPDASNPSTVTDANGNYTFTGLAAGTYTVLEVLPANGSLTTPTQTVVVSADHTASSVNFGERPSITGTVFTDSNSNGRFDTGELGVTGRTVFLDIDGSGAPDGNNPSATTDSNGVYFFSNLAPATYSVQEVIPSGVTLTTPDTKSAIVVSGQTTLAVNFGEAPPPFTDKQRFVIQLYHDLLRRDAEPQALQYWPGLLAAGQTRALVALEIEQSQEYRNDVATGLFELYLHRAPEAAALAASSNILTFGTPEQLSIDLVGSTEYYQSRGGGTNQGFLNALFSDVLHRSPDPAVASFLSTDDFSQQTVRLEVAIAVFGSDEHLGDLVSYPPALGNSSSGYVALGWYEAYLNRDAEAAAVAGAVSMLHGGTSDVQFVAGILGSDEYVARSKNATQ